MVDAPRDEHGAAGTPAPLAPIETAAGEPNEDGAPALDPRRAYEVLEIRTPLEEFESYVRARIDTLSRLGETDKAELAAKALEVGRRALSRVTGTAAPAAQERAQ